MARLECRSVQAGVPSVWVEVEGISDAQVIQARKRIDARVAEEEQPSNAVARGFLDVVAMCPKANPSDLWQHVVYRHLLHSGWSDQRWKRVSGFALERAFAILYMPRLSPHGLRMRILTTAEANYLLDRLGIAGTRATKVDMFLEGRGTTSWLVFGAAHVKASIAERIQDDVPASVAFQSKGLLSIALTMDSKSYPPPHGSGINYGEFGGRSQGVDKERLKRGYIETAGQFDGLFSFNLRTPPSAAKTPSGKRINTMSLSEPQPDQLVRFLIDGWSSHAKVKAP